MAYGRGTHGNAPAHIPLNGEFCDYGLPDSQQPLDKTTPSYPRYVTRPAGACPTSSGSSRGVQLSPLPTPETVDEERVDEEHCGSGKGDAEAEEAGDQVPPESVEEEAAGASVLGSSNRRISREAAWDDFSPDTYAPAGVRVRNTFIEVEEVSESMPSPHQRPRARLRHMRCVSEPIGMAPVSNFLPSSTRPSLTEEGCEADPADPPAPRGPPGLQEATPDAAVKEEDEEEEEEEAEMEASCTKQTSTQAGETIAAIASTSSIGSWKALPQRVNTAANRDVQASGTSGATRPSPGPLDWPGALGTSPNWLPPGVVGQHGVRGPGGLPFIPSNPASLGGLHDEERAPLGQADIAAATAAAGLWSSPGMVAAMASAIAASSSALGAGVGGQTSPGTVPSNSGHTRAEAGQWWLPTGPSPLSPADHLAEQAPSTSRSSAQGHGDPAKVGQSRHAEALGGTLGSAPRPFWGLDQNNGLASGPEVPSVPGPQQCQSLSAATAAHLNAVAGASSGVGGSGGPAGGSRTQGHRATPACKYFLKGECKHGLGCKFRHDMPKPAGPVTEPSIEAANFAALKMQAELERAKVDSHRARAEAHRARAESHRARAELFRSRAQARLAEAEAWRAEAESRSARAESQDARAASRRARSHMQEAQVNHGRPRAKSRGVKATAGKIKVNGSNISNDPGRRLPQKDLQADQLPTTQQATGTSSGSSFGKRPEAKLKTSARVTTPQPHAQQQPAEKAEAEEVAGQEQQPSSQPMKCQIVWCDHRAFKDTATTLKAQLESQSQVPVKAHKSAEMCIRALQKKTGSQEKAPTRLSIFLVSWANAPQLVPYLSELRHQLFKIVVLCDLCGTRGHDTAEKWASNYPCIAKVAPSWPDAVEAVSKEVHAFNDAVASFAAA